MQTLSKRSSVSKLFLFHAIFTVLLCNILFINDSRADVIPKNPQLLEVVSKVTSPLRGDDFTVSISVDAFDGYLFSAAAHYFTSDLKHSFSCTGFMPIAGDSSKVLSIQKGDLLLTCRVPRINPEGEYRLYYLDLSSVGCKIKYVMEISNPAGLSCPSAWTHYQYQRTDSTLNFKWWDPYSTENQKTSLNYPIAPFTGAQNITVRGYKKFETPSVEILEISSDRIVAQYFHGNDYLRDTSGLCAFSSDKGLLKTNWILLAQSLPLNGAAQPEFPTLVKVSVENLEPVTDLVLSIKCKISDGTLVSTEYALKSSRPKPPTIPSLNFSSISQNNASISLGFDTQENIKYSMIVSGKTLEFSGPKLDLDNLAPDTTYYFILLAKDSYGQISRSNLKSFTTLGTKKTITCIKEKSRLKVTGVDPKCPKGFTKTR